MASLIWAFGPEGRYFAKYKGRETWDQWYDNVPPELNGVITEEIACCAFGPSDSYVCVYDNKGQWDLCMSRNIPEKLYSWLQNLDSVSLGRLKVSMGPSGMFWASSGVKHIYGGWPVYIQEKLKKHLQMEGGLSFPEWVQIGWMEIGDWRSVVVVGEQGDNTTDLDDYYGELEGLVKGLKRDFGDEEEHRNIELLALDSFGGDNYCLVTKSPDGNREVKFTVPATLYDVAAKFKEKVEEGNTSAAQAIASTKTNATEEEDEEDEEEEPITTEDVAQVVKAFEKAQEMIEERDAVIAKYEEIFADYNETIEAAAKALKQKNDTIAEYEKLIEQLRNQKQSDSMAAARAIREANQQANVDFALRQRLQTLQYNTQMQCTAMMNMNTQTNVAMQNIVSNMWF